MTIAPRASRDSVIDSAHPVDARQGVPRSTPATPSENRLLYVATSAGDGGIERQAVLLARRVAERGYSLDAVVRKNTFFARECAAAGIPVRTIINRNAADLRAAFRIAEAIRETRATIVHVHSRRDYIASQVGVTIARRRENRTIRLILHAHLDKPLGDLHWLMGRLTSATADRIIAVSDSVRERLIRTHGLNRSAVQLLYNGIDTERFSPAGSEDAGRRREAARAEYGIGLGEPVIGMIGRLEDKGQDRAIAMMPAIRRAVPNARLLLVGPGKPGPRRRLVKASKVTGAVVFAGAVADIASVLPAIDVLAHLPDTESFGLALLEAMASGIPIVASAVGGCREIVVDGETGYLVDRTDMPATLSTLIKLLTDRDLRDRFGDAGRAVAARFSLNRQVDQLVEYYRELSPV